MDFQILLSLAEDFKGILFWRCLSVLPLSLRLAGIVKSLASYH